MNLTVLLMRIANCIIPKKDIIIFNSYPPFSDNAVALYQYVMNNRPDVQKKYELIWGQEKDAVVLPMIKQYNTRIVTKKSILGLWLFLRAKYIITTHGYFPGVKSAAGQIQVNLWHGCGYKSITQNEHVYRGDINIVTGEIYRDIHVNVFDMNKKDIYVTGLPRNDRLFSGIDALSLMGVNKKNYKKVYIWLPTYRKAALGHKGIDGDVNSFGIGTISEKEYSILNELFKQQNYMLIIKPHPMDSMAVAIDNLYSNIKVYTNQDIKSKGIDLYELLACTDGLLSDYSSVIVDYLLLDKPIAMVLSDVDEYKDSRGFVFEPIDDYFPGCVISNFQELINYFKNDVMINDKWNEKRNKIADLFHTYRDGQSAKRVCDLIWGNNF